MKLLEAEVAITVRKATHSSSWLISGLVTVNMLAHDARSCCAVNGLFNHEQKASNNFLMGGNVMIGDGL